MMNATSSNTGGARKASSAATRGDTNKGPATVSTRLSDSDEHWLALNRRRIRDHPANSNKQPPLLMQQPRLGRDTTYYQQQSVTRPRAGNNIGAREQTSSSERWSDSYDSYDSLYDYDTDDFFSEDNTTTTAATSDASDAFGYPPRRRGAGKPPVAWSVDTTGFRSPATSAPTTVVRVPGGNAASRRARPSQPVKARARHAPDTPLSASIFTSVKTPESAAPATTLQPNDAVDGPHAVQKLAEVLHTLLTASQPTSAPTVTDAPSGQREIGGGTNGHGNSRQRVVTVDAGPLPAAETPPPRSKQTTRRRDANSKNFFTYVVPSVSPPTNNTSSPGAEELLKGGEVISPNAPRLAQVETLPLFSSPEEIQRRRSSVVSPNIRGPHVAGAANSQHPLPQGAPDGGEEIRAGCLPPSSSGSQLPRILNIGDVIKYVRHEGAEAARREGGDDHEGSTSFFVLTHEQLTKVVSSLEERRMRVLYTPITASASNVRSLLGLGEVSPAPRPQGGDTPIAALRGSSPTSSSPVRSVSVIRVAPPMTRPPSVRALPTVAPMEEIQRAAAVLAPSPAAQVSTTQTVKKVVEPGARADPHDSSTTSPGAAKPLERGSAHTPPPGQPPHTTEDNRFAVPRLSSTPPRAGGVRVVSHEPVGHHPQQDARRRTPPPPPPPAQPPRDTDEGAYANIPLVQSLESSFASLPAEPSGASSSGGGRQLSVPLTRSRQGSPAPAPSVSAASRGGSRGSASPVPARRSPQVPTLGGPYQGHGSGGESLSPKRPHSPPKMRPGKSTQNIFLP